MYDVERIIKDLGTCSKTLQTHTILVISPRVLECIMEVGRYNVDGMLGADPKDDDDDTPYVFVCYGDASVCKPALVLAGCLQ